MSANELEGMHYDRAMRMYVPDVVSETPDPFTLTGAPVRVEPDSLPQSPKSLAKLAASLGWPVSCWASTGTMAPTLYMSDSEEGAANQYRVGDVRFDGYDVTLFVVEGREPRLPIGFRAHFRGKFYGAVEDNPKNKTRNSLGSFEYAWIADPVGVPVELRYEYAPIDVSRGDQEIEKYYRLRIMEAERAAVRMNREYNDGSYHMDQRPMLTSSKELTDWLTQWKEYGALSHETDRPRETA